MTKWGWFAAAAGIAIATVVLSPRRPDEPEAVARLLPELRLVARRNAPDGSEETSLYTGPGDADALTDRLDRALRRRPGWWAPTLKPGSSFPYHATFDRVLSSTWIQRIRWQIEPPSPLRPILDLRILRGRAGAKPTSGPWTTLLLRWTTRRPLPPDTFEPVPGWAVQR